MLFVIWCKVSANRMQKARFMLRCSLTSQCDFNHAAKLRHIFHPIASPNETKTDQNETNSKFIRIFAAKYAAKLLTLGKMSKLFALA